MINEETVSGDIAPVEKPLDKKVDKRPSFKEFFHKHNLIKPNKKGKDVLQKQKDKPDS